jgi:hypothetical protein
VKPKMPSITIRFGAAYNEVTVDDQSFDLNSLEKKDQNFLRRVVVNGLEAVGYFGGR